MVGRRRRGLAAFPTPFLRTKYAREHHSAGKVGGACLPEMMVRVAGADLN